MRTSSGISGFQSTHPLRGATCRLGKREPFRYISIHAPLAGCDPMRLKDSYSFTISIHAPLAGCDKTIRDAVGDRGYFNPRTPCGVRPRLPMPRHTPRAFQSTHPLRGATAGIVLAGLDVGISIHAPLAGCDAALQCSTSAIFSFQSTHPLRGATSSATIVARRLVISIHAPLAGCDL